MCSLVKQKLFGKCVSGLFVLILIFICFIGETNAASQSYNLNDADAQAMARLIKGEIDQVFIARGLEGTAALFVAVGQAMPNVIYADTYIYEEEGIFDRSLKFRRCKGTVITKFLGLFERKKTFFMSYSRADEMQATGGTRVLRLYKDEDDEED